MPQHATIFPDVGLPSLEFRDPACAYWFQPDESKKAPREEPGGRLGRPPWMYGGLTRATLFTAGYRADHEVCSPHRHVTPFPVDSSNLLRLYQ